MRLAILTDIHANREAFEAVMEDAAGRRVDRYIFLGDIVGYGPDPGWCIATMQRMRAEGALVVRGNHDRAIGLPDGAMNPSARRVIDWTVDRLTAAEKMVLAALPMQIEDDGVLFVHASAHAPQDWHYVTGVDEAAAGFDACTARLILCGHVHRAQIYSRDLAGRVAGHALRFGYPVPLIRSRRWMAVVGSVGQPRDGSALAGYAILDRGAEELSFHRVAYDSTITARKLRAAGLPDSLAQRLTRRF